MHKPTHELPSQAYDNANPISNIPEPSSAMLALFAVLILTLFRKR
jgi:hypothetical protein